MRILPTLVDNAQQQVSVLCSYEAWTPTRLVHISVHCRRERHRETSVHSSSWADCFCNNCSLAAASWSWATQPPTLGVACCQLSLIPLVHVDETLVHVLQGCSRLTFHFIFCIQHIIEGSGFNLTTLNVVGCIRRPAQHESFSCKGWFIIRFYLGYVAHCHAPVVVHTSLLSFPSIPRFVGCRSKQVDWLINRVAYFIA